ncbi:protein of unknown function (plasmid) [Cupriavidus taiwanensis]|nr:protein of unknown function [Cupriavidus taiwanensis]
MSAVGDARSVEPCPNAMNCDQSRRPGSLWVRRVEGFVNQPLEKTTRPIIEETLAMGEFISYAVPGPHYIPSFMLFRIEGAPCAAVFLPWAIKVLFSGTRILQTLRDCSPDKVRTATDGLAHHLIKCPFVPRIEPIVWLKVVWQVFSDKFSDAFWRHRVYRRTIASTTDPPLK